MSSKNNSSSVVISQEQYKSLIMRIEALEKEVESQKRVYLISDKEHRPYFKSGMRSALEILPNTFTMDDAIKQGVTKNTVHIYKHRGYVTTDDNYTYKKTDKFLKRMSMSQIVVKD